MRIRLFNLVEPVVPLFQELATAFGEEGHDVEALISHLDYRAGRPPLEERLDDRAKVRYLGGAGRSAGRLTRRIEMNLRYLLGVVRAVLAAPSGTVNIVLSQPPGVQALVVFLARLRRQRTIVHVMDVYPDVLVAAGGLAHRSVVHRLWAASMRVTLRRANAVVAIGECMALRLRNAGAPAEKTHVVRNWSRPIAPPDEESLRLHRSKLVADEQSLIVGYAGNMGVAHSFDALIETARRFQDRSMPVHFLLSGDGPRRTELEEAITDLGLKNVTLRGFVPEHELGMWLSIPHVHFVSLRPAFSGLVVPSKVYGALAAARPVIYEGDPATEVGADLERTGSGVCTRDANDLTSVLGRLFAHPDEYQAMSAAAARLARERGADSAMDSYRWIVAHIATGARFG